MSRYAKARTTFVLNANVTVDGGAKIPSIQQMKDILTRNIAHVSVGKTKFSAKAGKMGTQTKKAKASKKRAKAKSGRAYAR